MLLITRYNLLTAWFALIFFSPHLIFLAKFTAHNYLLDLCSRTSLNIFYFNIFHFFWTNLWYLYLFFAYVVFSYNWFKVKHIPFTICYITVLFFLFNYCIFMENIFSSTFNNFILMNSELSNILLKNSVNKVHPFLLYSSTIMSFIPLLSTFNTCKFNTINSMSIMVQQLLPLLKKILIFILIALYLGSWWALQEGSWGGWWNWDASEFLGLLILYMILSLFHMKKNLTSIFNLRYTLVQDYTYLFIFFFLLQLNFTTISHNFGFRTLKFLNTELLLLIMLILGICIYIYTLYNKAKVNTFFITVTKYVVDNYTILYYIVILINLTILLSLVSFIVKILLNFKFFFNFLNLTKLLFSMFFFSYQHFMFIHLYVYLILSLVTLQTYSLLILINYNYTKFKNFLTHYCVYWLFFLALSYKYSTLNDHIHINYNMIYNYNSHLSLNCREIELLLNFITTSTSFEGKSFELFIHRNYVYQVYLISTTKWNLIVNTIDQLPTLLNTLLTLALLKLTTFWFYKCKF